MSGGHFDYSYIRIESLAEQLERELSGKDSDDHSSPFISSFSPETIERLIRCQKLLHDAAKIAHDVEWLFSGDYGEETFAREVDPLIRPFNLGQPHLTKHNKSLWTL